VNQTTILIARKAPTTLKNSRCWIRTRYLGDGGDELECGRPLPRCLKQKHDADLPFFYVSNTGVQLQDSKWRTKDEQTIAPYGDRAFEFSTNARAADIPANSRKTLFANSEVDSEARFQARRPVLEVPDTIHITHFRVPVRIGANQQLTIRFHLLIGWNSLAFTFAGDRKSWPTPYQLQFCSRRRCAE
jgi:hypothetical protein